VSDDSKIEKQLLAMASPAEGTWIFKIIEPWGVAFDHLIHLVENAYCRSALQVMQQSAKTRQDKPSVQAASAQGSSQGVSGAGLNTGTGNTTVMWRNIPNNYSRDQLCGLIDANGFQGTYDFLYAPFDFSRNALIGYVFINFVTEAMAKQFFSVFNGFNQWSLRSTKVSEVKLSTLQGLDSHVQFYRNCPVMHESVAEEFRPLLFSNGQRVPFPPPTKKIRPPHLKDCRGQPKPGTA